MPRVQWIDEVDGGLTGISENLTQVGGLRDPFKVAGTDPFNSFADARMYVRDIARTISAGESLVAAVTTQGWGIPLNQPSFAAAFDLAFQARDFVARVVDEIQGASDWASAKIEKAFSIARQKLETLIGPLLEDVVGAIPVISQVIDLARGVVRIFTKLLQWLNRSGPKPEPADPYPPPSYDPVVDLQRTRFEVAAFGARSAGASPRGTELFSPPVWPGRRLDAAFNDVGNIIKSERPLGLVEVARLQDGTKLVRLRSMMYLSGLGSWKGQDINVDPYTFPSLVPGSGIGNGNPGKAFEGMFILRGGDDGTVGVTPVGARYPQLGSMAGPLSSQIAAATPMLYSVNSSELRRRWGNYFLAWLHGLALACGAGDWGEHAGVSPSFYSPLVEMAPTYQWTNRLSRAEAWAIRRWFGENFSSPITPKTSRHHFQEGGIGPFPWGDALFYPDTTIPVLYADAIQSRQVAGLQNGPLALYLQPSDQGVRGFAGNFTLKGLYDDAIDGAAAFSSVKIARAVCSDSLDESMIIDPGVRQLVESKRAAAGAGSLSACAALAMQSLEKPATDPGYVDQTPGIQVAGTQVVAPIEDGPGAGALGILGLAGLAAFALGGRR